MNKMAGNIAFRRAGRRVRCRHRGARLVVRTDCRSGMGRHSKVTHASRCDSGGRRGTELGTAVRLDSDARTGRHRSTTRGRRIRFAIVPVLRLDVVFCCVACRFSGPCRGSTHSGTGFETEEVKARISFLQNRIRAATLSKPTQCSGLKPADSESPTAAGASLI